MSMFFWSWYYMLFVDLGIRACWCGWYSVSWYAIQWNIFISTVLYRSVVLVVVDDDVVIIILLLAVRAILHIVCCSYVVRCRSYRIITMTSSLDIPPNSISNLDRSQAGGNFPLRKVLVKSAFLRKFEKEEWNFLDSKPLGSREFFDVDVVDLGPYEKERVTHRFIGYSSEIPWKFNSSPLKIYNPKKGK